IRWGNKGRLVSAESSAHPELGAPDSAAEHDLLFFHRLVAYEHDQVVAHQRVAAERLGLDTLRSQLTRVHSALQDDALLPVYQPIVDLRTLEPCGHEALSRFRLRPVRPPSEWFADADAAGFGPQLELRAIRSAIERRDLLPSRGYLS